LSFSATRSGELSGSIAAGCDRLIHPSVTDAGAIVLHRRLIGLLLAAPFLAAALAAILFPPELGEAATLAVVCACFGISWLLGLSVALGGRTRVAEAVALVLGGLAVSGIVAAAGGAASPAILLSVALPFEAWWLRRSPQAALWGAVAAATAIAGQGFVGSSLFADAAPASAWHWLVPLAYGACVAPRLSGGLFASEDATMARGDALEDIIDAVVLQLKLNGDVEDASAKARAILGVPPELLLFSGLFDRVHVADRVVYLCALADMRAGAERRKLELRLRVPGAAGQTADNYQPYAMEFARAGEGIVAILRDNGDMASLRDALAASTEETAGAEIAKSRFLAAVSHELRTPLNAIIGFSDMLLHEIFGGFNDKRQKEYVGLVRESGHHLLAVVNSILDVSRIESGAYPMSPELFRFADAVDMCRSMMSLQAEEKRIEFSARVAADIGDIHADRRAVQQILINLVSNAIKFTPAGGKVSIGAKKIGSRIHFWVSDTGIGIAPDDLGRLGQPFMQVQNDYTRQFEGTGLGLSLVKGLVSLHEGSLSIESEPGDGTTVTVSLPIEERSAPAQAGKAEIVAMPMGRPKEDGDGALRKTA
jgi:cell cycle sensor histidine kinase DivJ